MSPIHSWLCVAVVMSCELKYRNFVFLEKKPSLISLILNTKSEKDECILLVVASVILEPTKSVQCSNACVLPISE